MNTAILSYIPPSVSLYYIDYQDDLDEHEDIQQKCLQDNNFPCGNHCPHCGTFWVD